jgi:hypothetical protein
MDAAEVGVQGAAHVLDRVGAALAQPFPCRPLRIHVTVLRTAAGVFPVSAASHRTTRR